jgi:hypothetical protein
MQALRSARLKYGFVAIGKTGKAGLHARQCRYHLRAARHFSAFRISSEMREEAGNARP